jgi:hypothetical protein
MGVLETWDKVEFILNSNLVPRYPVKPVPKPFKKVWEKIPTLGNYNVVAGDDLWENFPSKPVPRNVTKRVDEKALKVQIEGVSKSLTAQQIKRADKLLDDLTWGASSYQLKELPPVMVPNASSAYEHGEMLTDKLATWVDTGIARGPLNSPLSQGLGQTL